MKIIQDFEGKNIRLTDERLSHILLHSKMLEMQSKIEKTLKNPDYIIQSQADKNVNLNLKFFITSQFAGKFLCVVVKYFEEDALIITSYLIRDLPKGEIKRQKN